MVCSGLGTRCRRGQTAVCTVAAFQYCTRIPSWGTTPPPPRVVPMLTNVRFARKGPLHRLNNREVHPVVAAYRTLSRGVDGVNQMVLQMRPVGRPMICVHTARPFVLRHTVANVFPSRWQLRLCTDTTSMWEWRC